MGIWDQNLTGHVPTFGRSPKNGNHLVNISSVEKEADSAKGPRVILTYKVESSEDSSNVGCTVRDYLYVMGDTFKGTEKHGAANRDNWYHLLTAINLPVSDIPVNELVDMMQGLRLGIRTATSEVKRQPGDTDEAFEEKKKSPFVNVKSYMPSSAVGGSSAATAKVTTDKPADDKPEADTEIAAASTTTMSLDDIV